MIRSAFKITFATAALAACSSAPETPSAEDLGQVSSASTIAYPNPGWQPGQRDIAGFQSSRAGVVQTVAYLDSNGDVDVLSYDGKSWQYTDVRQKLSAPTATGSLVATGQGGGWDIIDYVAGQEIYEMYGNATGWNDRDLMTQVPGSALTVPRGPLTTFIHADPNATFGNDRIVGYFSADGHVRYFSYVTSWSALDATGAAGGPPAMVNQPLSGAYTSVMSGGGGNYLFAYVTTDHHIHLLKSNCLLKCQYGWTDMDISMAAGATGWLPAGNSLSLASFDATGSVGVAYTTSEGHIHELSWSNSTGTWSHLDLTNLTGGGATTAGPSYGGPVTEVIASNGKTTAKYVMFVDGKGYLEEFSQVPGGSWSTTTVLPGAQPADSQLSVWVTNSNRQVAYTASNAHNQEGTTASGAWQFSDIQTGWPNRW